MSRTKLMHVPEIEAFRKREIQASADAAKPPRKWWSIAAWLDQHVAVAVHAHGVKVLTEVLSGHNNVVRGAALGPRTSPPTGSETL